MKTRDELEDERRRGDEQQEKSFIGIGGAIVIVLGGLAIWLFVMLARPAQTSHAPVDTAPVLTDSLQCDRLVELAQREGIIRGDRMGNRIMVDPKRWSALDPKRKSALIQYVACAAFAGRGLDSLDEGEVVEVVNADTRKPLARAGRVNGAVFTTDY